MDLGLCTHFRSIMFLGVCAEFCVSPMRKCSENKLNLYFVCRNNSKVSFVFFICIPIVFL